MSFIDSIRQKATGLQRQVAFPEGTDLRTLSAAALMQRLDLPRPVLLGPEAELRRGFAAAGGDAERVTIIDPAQDPRAADFAQLLYERRKAKGLTPEEAAQRVRDPLFFGAMLLGTGAVQAGVCGAVNTTGDVMRAGLWCIGTAPGVKTVSTSFYMVVPPFRTETEEVLTFTDCALVPDPTPEQLADIAFAAAQARSRIVGDEPRVAFLSFSTKGSAAHAHVEKVQQACALFCEQHPEIAADGELQLDAAIIASVGERKAPDSRVAGHANVLVFPDLDAGNIGYKLTQRLAHAEAVGPISQGMARPWNDLSRGATPDDIANVACIAALQA